ncbi:helix-turn-helix domain-containing protein [Streptomyces olivaceus]|uniref:helix-turn-helix domain-containing protein n=1 Tax=Streptomyces TaxID=1883 RepID=UPI00249279BD|nr:helix-turn-helix transcriptional regulator [Streptomyces olivaceus]
MIELARDIQEQARTLARLLPTMEGETPLRHVAQLQEQLDVLTAAAVGRARHQRVVWATVSTILRISEDTARHRYTERYILRRLSRFNRSGTALTSASRLFSPQPPGARKASGPDSDGTTPEQQQSAPAGSVRAAYNRLSPILSMLVRTAQLTNKELSSQIGCSSSYTSRILSGERVPTWELTRKFAQACGADPEVLRTVWETEKLRPATAVPAAAPAAPSAVEELRTAIRTLHLRAGRPAPGDIAVASRWVLSAGAVASLIDSAVLPPLDVLRTFVKLLGGDPDYFGRLLNNACRETSGPARSQPPNSPSPTGSARQHTAVPPTSQTRQDTFAGPDAVMKAFSKVLTEDHPAEDGRARLLTKLATTPPTPRRPLSTATDTLRQRLFPSPITPLGRT